MTDTPVSLGDMLVPNLGRIVVLVETKDEITPQGLFIPVDTARTIHETRPTRGVIVAMNVDDDEDLAFAGDGPYLKLGDTVVFGKYTGTSIEWQPPTPEGAAARPTKQRVVIMRHEDVLAKLLTPEQAQNLKVKV